MPAIVTFNVVPLITKFLKRTLATDEDKAAIRSDIGAAPIASPTFTGEPKSTTPTDNSVTTRIATTGYVATLGATKAPIASPTFTGEPKAPTPTDNSVPTRIATTGYVESLIPFYSNITASYVVSLPGGFESVTLSRDASDINGRPAYSGTSVDGSYTLQYNSYDPGVGWCLLFDGGFDIFGSLYAPLGPEAPEEVVTWTAGSGILVAPPSFSPVVSADPTISPSFIGQLCRVGTAAPYDWYIAESIDPVVWKKFSASEGDLALQPVVTQVAPTSGNTISGLPFVDEIHYVVPAGALPSLIWALPSAANAVVGQVKTFVSTQNIALLAVGSPPTLLGEAPTSAVASTPYSFQCISTADDGTWLRIK